MTTTDVFASLAVTDDDGEVLAFVVAFYGNAFAIVQYGTRVIMVPIEDLVVVPRDEWVAREAK